MKIVDVADVMRNAELRKQALIDAGKWLPDTALRNPGTNRTLLKTILLSRAKARAEQAGLLQGSAN